MNSCKNFSKKHPVILVTLSFFFMWGLVNLANLVQAGPLTLAAKEIIMAVAVVIVTILFIGKEKLEFSTKGLGYAFRTLRGYYIFMIIVAIYLLLATILGSVVLKDGEIAFNPIAFINIFVGCALVGIAEEFSFRGLMFGGLLQKLGNTKKGIILAAIISGILFGFAHVINSVVGGEIINSGAAATAVLKTFQCAIFGFILAFIYYKTRNLYVCAILHALDDFLLVLPTVIKNTARASYVGTDHLDLRVGAYIVFIIILIPCLVRCIKNITPGESIPFDDDFHPRKVVFEKKSKAE